MDLEVGTLVVGRRVMDEEASWRRNVSFCMVVAKEGWALDCVGRQLFIQKQGTPAQHATLLKLQG